LILHRFDVFMVSSISTLLLLSQDAWQSELYQRYPLLQYVREWETFMLGLIKFEEDNHNSSVRKERVSSHNTNAKFRTLAAQTVSEGLQNLTAMITEYHSRFNKAFEVRGVVYLTKLEQQRKAVANVKTNFSGFKRDQLVLVDSEKDEILPIAVSPVVAQLLDDEERYAFIEFIDHSRGVL
jgi:CRISPR/Cas system-associated endonuclease Cas1